MEIGKADSLKVSFWKFLIMLITGMAGAVLIPFTIMILAVTFGYATYADYSEQGVEYIAPIMKAAPDFSEVTLPAGVQYVRLDKKYQVIETTLTEEDLKYAMEYAVSGEVHSNSAKQYRLVTRENEYVVLQYYIGSQYTIEWMNRYLPSPELLMYILMGVNGILVCIILTNRFSKKLRLQLVPIFEATEEISARNLDFRVGHSDVTEFEEVLRAFSKMKDSLKNSLEQQWKMEHMQKEQMAALAHDLKTPLTVIQGNIDLMSETKLDEEQKVYAGYIMDGSEQIQFYIKTLIEISRASAGYQLHKEEINFSVYMEQIKEQVEALCYTKKVNLKWDISSDTESLILDRMLVERSVMNVVNNALDYSSEGGTIYITARCMQRKLQFCIVDEGKGFTEEALQHAQEQFFMDNHSRSSRTHFGMGLYIAASVMRQHNGSLFLENDKNTHGAKVILELPI